ncbi:hypothetical protein BDV24DRAFT_144093 [Aspergillus arachidicola]|uniref:Uncharacterized protein n=1 Tax=Aspergillus arachidicola TaxID=656916 RepID=A0A5N6XT29_9EURO|nr:hypothetical protein BDV24DRAFT_144093 [Aspergillus arachidicola]
MAYSQVSDFTDQFSEADFLQSDDLSALSNTCRTATSVALSDPRQYSQQLAPSSYVLEGAPTRVSNSCSPCTGHLVYSC